jgi:bacillolysin
MKKHLLFFVTVSLALSSLVLPAAGEAAPPTPSAGSIDSINRLTESHATVAYHAATGQVRFIGTDRAHPIPQPNALPPAANSEVAAREFLATYGPLFGIENQADQLEVMKIQTTGDRSFVRFQQVTEGVPVLGGELVVQLNTRQDVLSVNGEILPDPAVSTAPVISSELARQRAIEKIAKDYGATETALQATTPELWVYSPLLLGAPGLQRASLAWRVEVQARELAPIKELVLVDATRGNVLLSFSEIDTALYREIYDNQNDVAYSLPGNGPVRIEGQEPTGAGDVDKAYDYAGDVYDFYLTTHGRDSLDGAGMPLISTVRYCALLADCPYANAFWNGEQMVYGDGFVADDVVGHEMTHGVTDFESHLFYYMQSGAISESLSDIWGEFVDLSNGKGNDSPAVRWLAGEDLPIGAIRSMKNPPAYGNPDTMRATQYECSWYDDGGVHTNSGVANKAAYLMVDGDTFNGQTVTGLGIAKAAAIFYEAQIHMLTSAGDYQDLYNDLQQACTNLVGTSGITMDDCQQVKMALDAVEMSLQPTDCAANEAPTCPGGLPPMELWSDNLEIPTSGRWITDTISGTASWFYPQNPNPHIGFDATYATSGRYNFFGDDPNSTTDSTIAMASSVFLPTDGIPHLRFNHAYDFEAGVSGRLYDGGVIEVSTDGGSSWSDAGGMLTNNGYVGTLDGGPLAGRRAFGQTSHGYISSRLNLSVLSGQDVRFRFRVSADSSVMGLGWFIDDIRLYTCQPAAYQHVYLPTVHRAPCAEPIAPVLNPIVRYGGGAYTVSWDAAAGATGYVLEEDDNPAFSSPESYSISGTSKDFTGVPAGTYYYRVRASNACDVSRWSDVQSVTVGGACDVVTNDNFELGPVGWTEYSTHGWPLITRSFPGTVGPHSGSWAVWLGGENDEISYVQQQITVPPSCSWLVYYHWIASQDACGFDFGGVTVNGTVVDRYDLCGSANTGGWVEHAVDLSAYAGQSVSVQIRSETDRCFNSNLFVDDVAFQPSSQRRATNHAPNQDPAIGSTKAKLGGSPQGLADPAGSRRLLGEPPTK